MYIYKSVNAKHSHAVQRSWNDAWGDARIKAFRTIYPKSGGFDWYNEKLPSSTKDRSVSGVNYKEWLDKELTYLALYDIIGPEGRPIPDKSDDNIKIDYDYKESDLTRG